MPRFYCPLPLATGADIDLPASAARHVQVLRLQPGDGLTLFNGAGGEFEATVLRMGRSDVQAQVGAHHAVEREAARAVHLLAGITAGERMDWLIEKATELGAASITPLAAERSVLRLKGERADKRQAHWQAVAVAACEQCGRNRVPPVHTAQTLADWLAAHAPQGQRLLLSLQADARPLRAFGAQEPAWFLSGPEGGLSPAEEALALAHGFAPTTLGPRVLRAETAPLAALAALLV
ncbi:MAG: 16S rRNA (uracil(1498)-N(3))-methyltransferase [Acidovorax sp.]